MKATKFKSTKAYAKMGLAYHDLLENALLNNGKLTRAFDYEIFWHQIIDDKTNSTTFL